MFFGHCGGSSEKNIKALGWYSKVIMARSSKYTPELKDQLVHYIASGLTVRDACYGAGISEDTFWRWNREKLDFAEAIKQATAKAKQEWSGEALMRTSEYRRYTRKTHICSKKPIKYQNPIHTHLDNQKPQNQALMASESTSVAIVSEQNTSNEQNTLPTRTEPLANLFGEIMLTKPYYNPTTDKVEWVEKELYRRCVLHRCEKALWIANGTGRTSP